MSTADIVAQTLATGGASSLGSLGKGLITVAKSFGDDFLRTFIKTYGDDAVRAIAAYGDDAAKLALNSADDATKLLLSSGDDLSKAALSYGDDIGKPLASTGDKMIDDWYGLVDDTVDGAASSWDDVANSLDDVADDALAAKPNTGYNGIDLPGTDIDYSKFNFNKYLRDQIGAPPSSMIDPHAHHILFKEGNGMAQKALVQEGQALLRNYGIDPIFGFENLTWAPNRIVGQHDIKALTNVVDKLKEVESALGDYDDIVEMLKKLGNEAAWRLNKNG